MTVIWMLLAAGWPAATVYPLEHHRPLHNPLMGWVLIDHATPTEIDAGTSVADVRDGTAYEWFSNVAVMSTWQLVEPQPDVYDWSWVDQAVDAWSVLGKTIHLRFSTDDFGHYPGCPRWLFEQGVPSFRRPEGTLFPDYNHPLYRERLRRFMGVFAARFGDDPRIGTINLQAYGNWGEWHSGFDYAEVEDRVRALRGLVDIWREATAGRKVLFLSCSPEWQTVRNSGTPLLPAGTSIHEGYPPTYAQYRYRSGFDYGFRFPDVALSRHGVGGCVRQEYDGRLMAVTFQEYRKPLYMEFFGRQKDFRGPSIVGFPNTREGDDFLENALDEALSHRPNYISVVGWYARMGATAFYNEDRLLVLKGLRWMGHRLVLVKATYPDAVPVGGKLCLRQSWENRALGRCYGRFPLTAYLTRGEDILWSETDEQFDQRSFVAGETCDVTSRFSLPASLPPGRYDLRIAMVGADGRPAVNLAIEGGDEAGRYLLGMIEVVAGASSAAWPDVGNEFDFEPLDQAGPRWHARRPLMPGRQYLVSFRYQVTADPTMDLHTADPGYFGMFARTVSGSHVAESRWFDKAGQPPACKTLLVCTEPGGEHRLTWEAVGGGTMIVDQVRVTELAEETVQQLSVAAGDVRLLPGASLFEQSRISCTRDRTEVRLPEDWHAFAETDPQRVSLQPNTVYTVWFECAARPQVWQGDYFYLMVGRDSEGDRDAAGFFRWTQRHTSWPVRPAYSFRTGPFDDYRLWWGIKNGGECSIANIVLVER